MLIRIYKYKLEINAFIIFIAYKYIIKMSQPNHAASNLTCTWLWTNCDLYQLPWPYVKCWVRLGMGGLVSWVGREGYKPGPGDNFLKKDDLWIDSSIGPN